MDSDRPNPSRSPFNGKRGSVLLVAMMLSLITAIGLLSYLHLSRNSLALAHRTYFANDARNLAEAGIEEALYCFQRMNSGTAATTAWTGWTTSGCNATHTLPSFNRDQNAMATVKVFVSGYNGSQNTPFILSQAVITPFDGSTPVIKTLRLGLKKGGYFANGIVAINGLSWNGPPMADSFVSNAAGNPAGPFVAYPGGGAKSNAPVVIVSGSVDLGSQGVINGNLNLGPGVTPPPANKVTGTIQNTFSGSFPLPLYPSSGSVSQSYNLGSSIPATLPVAGHLPASDGNYYYFAEGASLGATTISSGASVILVGTNTNMDAGLSIQSGASLKVYIDGTVNASGNGAINNANWAGALQIFTSTSGNCSIGGNGVIYACLYAPNASLTGNGGGSSGMLVGSFISKTLTSNGHMEFHYDETLLTLAGKLWTNSSWFELQSSADKSLAATLSDGFLQ